jgi:serine protease Do
MRRRIFLLSTVLLVLSGILTLSTVALADDTSTLVNYVKPGVVMVVEGNQVVGAGFIVNPEGYAVTCAHVVGNNSDVALKLAGGQTIQAHVLKADTVMDLAILKTSVTNLPSLSFSVAEVKAGQDVIAIGAPLGMDFTVSQGNVSDPARQVNGKQYIQSDIAINPGNSGGPLIDESGCVIGVNSSKIMNAEGIAFAIPAQEVMGLLTQQKIAFGAGSGTPETSATGGNTGANAQSGQAMHVKQLDMIILALVILLIVAGATLFWLYRRKRMAKVVYGRPRRQHSENLDDVDIELK